MSNENSIISVTAAADFDSRIDQSETSGTSPTTTLKEKEKPKRKRSKPLVLVRPICLFEGCGQSFSTT
jgi:hypothetical protein